MVMQSQGIKLRTPVREANPMRTIRLPRLPALLAALMVLSAAPLASRQKDLSDPDKIGHRNVTHRCIISPEK